MQKNRIFYSLTLMLLVALLISSCSAEKQAAYKYLKNTTQQTILLSGPEMAYKKEINVAQLKKEGVSDSLIAVKQSIMDSLDVSKYVNDFMKSYIKSLEDYGYKIVLRNDTSNYNPGEVNYVINVAQIEFEEFSEDVREEYMADDYLYYYDFTLENFFVNNWFEISGITNKDFGFHVAYADDGIAENYFGNFTTDKGKLAFDIQKFPIKPKNIYDLATELGENYATYTFDFLLNQNIKLQLGLEYQPNNYYTFDPNVKILYPAPRQFTIIDE